MSLIFNFVREARAFAAIIHSVILGIVFLSSLAASAVLAAVDESYVSRDGLHLWLNADALARDPITQLGLDSGDAVAQWPDSSGLGNHAVQPTSANRPTFIASSLNGRAVVRFSAASKHYLSVATPWFNPPTLTLVVVAKRTSGTGLAMVADKYNGSTTYGITFNSASVCAAYINNSAVTAPFSSGTFNLFWQVYDQQKNRIFINGVSAAVATLTTPIAINNNDLTIGGRAATYNLDGDIAEIFLYSRSLQTSERKNLEAYINSKYGVGSQPMTASPVPDKRTGTYSSVQEVMLTAPSGTTIRYTIDGTAPTSSSTVYTSPILITSQATTGTTIRAIALKEGYAVGPEMREAYIIDLNSSYLSRDGLKLWLRSDTLPSTPIAVETWSDQSGNSNHATQPTSANRPVFIAGTAGVLNGKPVVGFTRASRHHLDIPSTDDLNLSRLTVVGLVRRNVDTSDSMLFLEKGPNVSNGYVLRMNSHAQINHYVNNNNAYTATTSGLSASDYHLYAARYDLREHSLYKDDLTNPAVTNVYTADIVSNTDPITIGGRVSDGNLEGHIVELAIYDRALTDGELSDLHLYYKQRYALTGMPAVQLAPPVSSVLPGVYAQAQLVSLSAQDGALIYYTTDGTTPQQIPEHLYSGSFQVASTTTIKAIAVKAYYVDSPVLSAIITIDSSTVLLPRSGLRLWLSGADLQAGAIDVWRDLSGNGNDAKQSNASYRPSRVSGPNGKYSAAFTAASKHHLTVADSAGMLTPVDKFSSFVVAKRTAGTSLAMCLDRGVDNVAYSLRLNSLTAQGYVNANVASANQVGGQPLALNTFYRFGQVYDGANNQLFINGYKTAVAYAAPVEMTAGPLSIGGRTITYNLDGHISEVLFYDRALSKDERMEVEAYLYAKYAVGSRPKLEVPVSSVKTGIYTAAVSLTLSSMPGSSIQYRINGGAWINYDPELPVIVISSTSTLEAYATRADFETSDIGSEVITIDASTELVSRNSLGLWLCGNVGVVTNANGGAYGWYDQSGNKNHAFRPSNAGNLPAFMSMAVNGRPGLAFDGTDFLEVADASSLDGDRMTIIAVARRTSGSGVATILEKGNGSSGYIMQATSMTAARSYMNGSAVEFTGLVSNEFHVLVSSSDQSRHRLFVNGVEEADVAYTAAVNPRVGSLTIGGRSATYNFGGFMTELLVYTRALSDDDRQAIESYLHTKYLIGQQPKMTKPTSSVKSGVFSLPQQFTLSSKPGAVIHYTLDGTAPSASSSIYANQTFQVEQGQTLYVRAIATKPGFAISSIHEVLITVESGTPPVPQDGLKLWLRADSLASAFVGPVSVWPDQSGRGNDATQPSSVGSAVLVDNVINGRAAIHFPASSVSVLRIPHHSDFTPSELSMYVIARRAAGSGENALVKKTGTEQGYILEMATPSLATLRASITYSTGTIDKLTASTSTVAGVFNSIWGGWRIVDASGRVEISANGASVSGVGSSAALSIRHATSSSVQIGGPSDQDGDIAEVLFYGRQLTDFERQQLHVYASRKYGVGPAVTLPAPVFSIGSGRYEQPQAVTLSGVAGAIIYYTIDGTEPSSSSLVYGSALAVSSNITIKAKAVQAGYLDSPVATLKLQIGASESEIDEGVPAGFSTDTDGDGIPDAIETATGRDPGNPADAAPEAVKIYNYDPLQQLQTGPGRTYQYDSEGNIISQ